MENKIINDIRTYLSKYVGGVHLIENDVFNLLRDFCVNHIINLYNYNEDINVTLNNNGDIDIKTKDSQYSIDIKIQDINKVYSFPNMISIKKAKDFLSKPNNYIIYIFVEYDGQISGEVKISRIKVQRIETLDWKYLYIQNLGRGQLQIKNIPKEEFTFNNDVTRIQWLSILIDKGIEYYNNLMLKVAEYKSEWEKKE
jgi:hypothetical protein